MAHRTWHRDPRGKPPFRPFDPRRYTPRRTPTRRTR